MEGRVPPSSPWDGGGGGGPSSIPNLQASPPFPLCSCHAPLSKKLQSDTPLFPFFFFQVDFRPLKEEEGPSPPLFFLLLCAQKKRREQNIFEEKEKRKRKGL